MRKFLLTLTAVMCSLLASADEGMWMLSNINPKTAQKMKELGLTLTPEQLYNPNGRSLKDAVINGANYVDRNEIKYIVDALKEEL